MTEECDLLQLRQIPEFFIGGEQPLFFDVRSPLCIFIISASKLIVYNTNLYISYNLLSKDIDQNAVVLSYDISMDNSNIVTGLSDGTMILWSINSKSVVYKVKRPEPITNIAFYGSSTTVLSGDINGKIEITRIHTSFLGSKSVSETIYDFQQPLTYLKVNQKTIYVSTATETTAFTYEDVLIQKWSVPMPLQDMSFNSDLIGAIANKNVIIYNNSGEILKKYEYLQTPSRILLIDINTFVIAFPQKAELIVEDKKFFQELPFGTICVSKEYLYIYGQKLYVLSPAPIKDRVNSFIKIGKWDMALSQIRKADDLDNLFEILDKYIESESFDPKLFFSTSERLNISNEVTNRYYNNKKILLGFVDENIRSWNLSRAFIVNIIKTYPDKLLLSKYLSNISLSMEWVDSLLITLLDIEMYEDAFHIAYNFCGDVTLSLQIAHTFKLYKLLGFALNDILSTGSNFAAEDCIDFVIKSDLSEFIQFDTDSAGQSLKLLLKRSGERRPALAHSLMSAIGPSSDLWADLLDVFKDDGLTIGPLELPLCRRFVAGNGNKKLRADMLQYLIDIKAEPIKDLIILARRANLLDIQLSLIAETGDVGELVQALLENNCHSFCAYLRETVVKPPKLKEAIQRFAQQLAIISVDELCAEMWASNDIELIDNSVKTLEGGVRYLFLSKLLEDSWAAEHVSDTTVELFIRDLAKYRPDEVHIALCKLKQSPYDRLLKVCIEHGIAGAALYCCQMTRNTDKAAEIGRAAILDSLMAGDTKAVSEVAAFLGGAPREPEYESMWGTFFDAFQLPLYALQSNREKMAVAVSQFEAFVSAMVLEIDPPEVCDRLTELFAFLPFAEARPILRVFFKAVSERNAFARTFERILKDEAIALELRVTRESGRGEVVDARRCGKCRRLLGTSDAWAARCGHVFHVECAADGWCEDCRRSFTAPAQRGRRQSMAPAILDGFDGVVRKEKKPRRSILVDLEEFERSDLAIPRIGNVEIHSKDD